MDAEKSSGNIKALSLRERDALIEQLLGGESHLRDGKIGALRVDIVCIDECVKVDTISKTAKIIVFYMAGVHRADRLLHFERITICADTANCKAVHIVLQYPVAEPNITR